MTESIADPRSEIGQYAPKLSTIQVPVDAIGMIIGKGGETIRSITEETGAQINVDDDGTVTISSPNGESAAAAIETIKTLISKPEVGTIYMGKVKDIREDLGAFVEILPRTDGLVHISEIARERVSRVSDHLKQGDRVKVKLIDIRKDQRSGKIRYALSIKALLDMPAESENVPPAQGEQNQ